MKKTIIIILSIIAVGAALFGYMNYRNRSLSPAGEAKILVAELNFEVSYSRPSVRDRLIFGTEEEGALQPFGQYWRFGANEATEITFNQDLSVNNNVLKAGKYSLYAIPGLEAFTVGFNGNTGNWGYSEPDYEKDIFTTKIPVTRLNNPVEQFTISLDEIENGVLLTASFSDYSLMIPFKKL